MTLHTNSDAGHYGGGRPPPKSPFDALRKWAFVGCGVVLLSGAVWYGTNSMLNQRALAQPDVIHVTGLALKVHDINMRPLDELFSVHATVSFVDNMADRSISQAAFYNGVCTALLASDLMNIPAERVFRATFFMQNDGVDAGTFVVGVQDGRCVAHMADDQTLYTMPRPLNGWILHRWDGSRAIWGGDDVTVEFKFISRVDADPDMKDFDFDFACRVVMADWPVSVPNDLDGRPWTHIEIVVESGTDGRFFNFGTSRFVTYEIDDPICVGEAA